MQDDINKSRNYARRFAHDGMAKLAHAFNACEDESRDYIYSKVDLDRFQRVAMELVDIVENGSIKLRQIDKAKNDRAFQTFMTNVIAK